MAIDSKFILHKLTHSLELITNSTSHLGKDWYHEYDRNSDHLLITAGDSWTWGDSLDPNRRTEQIYGALLSKKQNCDWINVGLPGESNLVIKDYVTKVFDNLVKKYKSIVIIFTLTESTRDLVSLEYCENNYNNIKSSNWPNNFTNFDQDTMAIVLKEFPHSHHMLDIFKLYLAIQKCTTINSLVTVTENVTVECIKEAFPKPVKLILARNFTSWSNINNSTINETWTENTARNGNLPAYPQNVCFGTISMGADRLISCQDKFGTITNFKQDLLSHMNVTEKVINWLTESPYNSNFGTKHPLKQAHAWWADHLYKESS